ncbi:MAG: RidA family protein [Acidimicrobiia bacterium]
MITRLNPDVGSLDPAYLDRIGLSAVVVHAGVAHIQGVTPMTGGRDGWQVVGVGSMADQVRHVLEVIDRLLASIGGDRSDVLVLTVYTTDQRAFSAALPVLTEWTGEHRPAVTAVQVAGLAAPEQLVEISAVARAR